MPAIKELIPSSHQTSNFPVGARLAVPKRRLSLAATFYYLYDRNLVLSLAKQGDHLETVDVHQAQVREL